MAYDTEEAKTALRILIGDKRRELRVLEGIWSACFETKGLAAVTSPSTANQGGGGASPAAPAGEAGLREEPTHASGASAPEAAVSLPLVILPPNPERALTERIAVWLEEHAAGYEHGGELSAAYALREKAAGIRRHEFP